MTTGGTASQCHCEAYKHFSQLHLEPALVLILNSLSIPVLKNAKNKEENIQEMELWNPGHARESKQADASTYSLTSVDVASVQEHFDSRKWAFIVAGLLVISNQLQHLFSYWYVPFFFPTWRIIRLASCFNCPFKTLEMNQQDSNHSDCLHSAREASDMIHIPVVLLCISLAKTQDMFYDRA